MLERILEYLGLKRSNVSIIESKKSGYTHIIINQNETISFNAKLGIILLNNRILPLEEVLVC